MERRHHSPSPPPPRPREPQPRPRGKEGEEVEEEKGHPSRRRRQWEEEEEEEAQHRRRWRDRSRSPPSRSRGRVEQDDRGDRRHSYPNRSPSPRSPRSRRRPDHPGSPPLRPSRHPRQDYADVDYDRGELQELRSQQPRSRPREPLPSPGREDPTRYHWNLERERRQEEQRQARLQEALGEPCTTIMLSGLAPTTTTEQIEAHLEFLQAAIESVSLIRHKATGESRGFAFVTFISTEHARLWMDAHAPSILIDRQPVRVKYSRTIQDPRGMVVLREGAGGAQASGNAASVPSRPPPLSRAGPRSQMSTPRAGGNTGAQDVDITPSHMLLIQGLDMYTTEESLYATVASIAYVRVVRLVRERGTKASLGFAFVEFYDVATAMYFLSLVYQQVGISSLSINGRCVAVSYARSTAFVPTAEMSDWVAATYQDATGALHHYQYWDEQAYCVTYPPELVSTLPSQPMAAATTMASALMAPTLKQDPAVKESGVHSNAPATEADLDRHVTARYQQGRQVEPITAQPPVTASQLDGDGTAHPMPRQPAGPEEQSLRFLESLDEEVIESEVVPGRGEAPELDATSVSVSEPTTAASASGPPAPGKPAKSKLRKPGPGARAVSNQIQKWNAIAASKAATAMEEEAARTSKDACGTGSAEEDVRDESAEELVEESEEARLEALVAQLPTDEEINRKFTNTETHACLLCRRQFKAPAEVLRHHALSELHHTNLAAHRQRVLAELRGTYRPGANYGYRKKKQKPKAAIGSAPPDRGDALITRDIQHVQASRAVVGEDNKGHQMLVQMGWSKGSGLGKEASGIVEPIKGVQRPPGMGLGVATRPGPRR